MLSHPPSAPSSPHAGGGDGASARSFGGAPSPWTLLVSALRRTASSGGVAPSAGLLNTVPTTAVGAADPDTSHHLARRSSHRDHSAAAVEARRLEEEQADQAEAEANARAVALVQQQEQHERRLAHRQSHSSNAGNAPRFHIDEHSDEEEAERRAAKQPAHAASHAPAAAADSDAVQGRPWLDRIKDPEIRDVLDPDSSSFLNESTILKWSDAKLMELVKCFEPEHVEGLLTKLRRGQVQAEGAVADGRSPAAIMEDFTTTLSWRNLYYSLNGTVLLQNVSGYVKPGMLVAVLGGPDAGITTLLDILAQRAPVGGSSGGQLIGDIFVNRRPPDATFGRRVGYVKKDDIHLPQLTVAETLYFSARLRNPHLSRRGAFVRVALIMKLLGLLHTWSTPIGDDIIRGISGGEKRRVSFGLELVAGLQTLIADLPTNGLDSTSALSLLHVYKTTTLIGRAMICSLVQPSPQIYTLLDMVIVLSKGAQLYFGPPDLAIRHFESLGFERPAAKSVPQFLEELSAAPEKFVSIRLLRGDRLLAQRPQRRPLALLREREKRFNSGRRRLLQTRSFLAAGSRAGAAGSPHHQIELCENSDSDSQEDEAPSAPPQQRQQQQPSLNDIDPSAASSAVAAATVPASAIAAGNGSGAGGSGGRALSSVPEVVIEMGEMQQQAAANRAGQGSKKTPGEVASASSPLSTGADGALKFPSHSPSSSPESKVLAAAGAGAGAAPSKPLSRYQAWRALVAGFQSSIFEADIGYVLHNELMPLPHFHRAVGAAAKAKAKRKAAKEKAAREKAAAAAQAQGAVADPAGSPGSPRLVSGDSFSRMGFVFNATSDSGSGSGTGSGSGSGPGPAGSGSRPDQARYMTSFSTQYVENLIRLVVLFYRNRGLWLLNFVKSVLIGLLIGSLFWMVSLSQNNVRTRFGLAYFCLSFNSANAQQLVPVMLSFRRVFQLQKEGRYYRPLTYHLALLTVNIPIAAVETFLFFVVVYPMSGLAGGLGGAQAGYFFLMLLLVNLVSRAWVMMLTSVTSTEALTNIVNGISLVVFSIFSGYLNPRDSIPAGWIWAYYISYFTWALRGLMINEQTGLVYDCDPNSLIPCQYPTGEAALQLYGMDGGEGEKWLCVLWMGLFLVGYIAVAAAAMAYVNLAAQDKEEEPDFEPVSREMSAEAEGAGAGARRLKSGASSAGSRLGTPVHAAPPKQLYGRPSSSAAAGAGAVSGSGGDAGAGAGEVAMHVPLATHALPPNPAHESSALIRSESASGPKAEQAHAPGGYISWSGLSYTVEVGGAEKQRTLLHEVFGFARPGMMVALMGASGAGKTTLLDVLAGKKTGGTISGSLLVNGLPRDESFMRIAGYVEQFDSHHERSTVREAVRFSAMLRLPASVTSDPEEVERRVDHVLAQLGLTRLQHDLIGNASTGGISQAARKKVTIAVEMIGEPRILFLDESGQQCFSTPTTGLDSAGALDVLECVSLLSASMAVLCTVHQPSQELMERFNYLCLLQSGGRTVYFGELARMAGYFAGVGMPVHRDGDNLADYAIRCVKSGSGAGALLQPDGSPVDLSAAFKTSAGGKEALQSIESGVAPAAVTKAWTAELEQLRLSSHQGSLAPFSLQFNLLLRRFSWGLVRSPDLWGGRLFAQLLMSFIIGTCFFRLSNSQQDAQNRVSCLFLTVQFVMGSGALKLPAIFSERSVVFRERQSRMYSVEAYYLARWLHDAWLWAIENFIFIVMVYFICNLNDADNYARFGLFYLLLLLTAQLGFSLSELVALVSATPASAYALQGAVSTVFSLFSGFLIAKSNMPVGWSWAYYVSPNRYPLTASLQNEMRGQRFDCGPELQFVAPAPICGQMEAAVRCPVACGEQLLESLGVSSSAADEAQNFGLIAVYVIGFKLLGYFAFKYINHIKR